MIRFHDRLDAGCQLGAELVRRGFGHGPTLVLALPRGGVPVGREVARSLGSPLDVFIVRKLGVPGSEELAFGAIASGGIRCLNDDVLRYYSIDSATLARVTERETRELERREKRYRGSRPPIDVAGKRVIVCDDGLATGATMRAAVRALRQLGPAEIVVAVPVSAADTFEQLGAEADQIVCLAMPEPFQAVGIWYEVFDQTSDEEVMELLGEAAC